ncbi:hypothetical protein [Peribacillus cavernae]|uniref:hypothetical protein n=1 Tax=Peribacillus cavernae TaxID=1674310 RepID=UPI001FEA52FC|nr:hypothetical protein [Peribacillus cavernae]MDQ0218658.1 hypothetical protein [Peribacillus cavernae]
MESDTYRIENLVEFNPSVNRRIAVVFPIPRESPQRAAVLPHIPTCPTSFPA